MVPPDSSGLSRGPEYSGTQSVVFRFRVRGYHPVSPAFPGSSTSFRRTFVWALQPRTRNLARFGLFRFRSPLLTESRLIYVPPGTEMFQFPGLAPSRVTRLPVPGFPIRKSSDHRVLARFPKLIAGSCVLHRLLLPRHPSCALCSLNSPMRSIFRRTRTLRLPGVFDTSSTQSRYAISKSSRRFSRRRSASLAEEQTERKGRCMKQRMSSTLPWSSLALDNRHEAGCGLGRPVGRAEARRMDS